MRARIDSINAMDTKMMPAPWRKRAKRAVRRLVRVGTGARARASMLAAGTPRAFKRIDLASKGFYKARAAALHYNRSVSHTYSCPEHGAFEVTVLARCIPDEMPCTKRLYAVTPGWESVWTECDIMSTSLDSRKTHGYADTQGSINP